MKYFDFAATTPCALEVVREMEKFWLSDFGNPDSRSHSFGWIAEEAVDNSRKVIARFLGVEPSEIVFTSGATEANNLAIKGFALGASFNKKVIAALVTEHKCIIEALRSLKQDGFEIDFIPVLPNGLVNMEYLIANITRYALVSISAVNNETGVMQDISALSKLCRNNGVKFHSDCAQAFGKIPLNAREVDFMSLSAHKIYGPKGVGVLFVSKNPRVRIRALFNGGGQQNNMRSGTLPTPLCVGMAKAAELIFASRLQDFDLFSQFQRYILDEVVSTIPMVSVNGTLDSKIPHILNLSVPYVEGESLLMRMNEFALSSGSACTSKSLEPSYVISAMNPESKELAHSSLRISFGHGVVWEDIKLLVESLKKHIVELRALSPLWHMVKRGVDLKSISWVK